MLMGLMFLAGTVFYFSKAVKISKSRKVKGKLIDYSEIRQGSRILYSPVYEYENGGEVKRYSSSRMFTYQEPFGTEKILLISENGEVSD